MHAEGTRSIHGAIAPYAREIVVVGPAVLRSAVLSETGRVDLKMSLSTLVKVIFGGHAASTVT